MLHFTKMHGLGNDFVVIEDRADTDYHKLARSLCDRHRGIGADGLIVIGKDAVADCRMRIFNADGSEAQMCGNGVRCVGKYIRDNGLCSSPTPIIATMSGHKKLYIKQGADGTVESVTVDMGLPETGEQYTLATPCGDFSVTEVSTGNPHGVAFVSDPSAIALSVAGPALECAEVWPQKANIEFAAVDTDRHTVYQRTWERGVGETEACGTGACATAAAAVATGRADYPVEVHLTGGVLLIDIDPDTNHLLMTGPAETVFTGPVQK